MPERAAILGLQLLEDAVMTAGPELTIDDRLHALLGALVVEETITAATARIVDRGTGTERTLDGGDRSGSGEAARPDSADGRDRLTVPLTGRSGAIGYLDLVGSADGTPISALSRQLSISLAAVTARALDSAGPEEERRQEHLWLEASVEINGRLIRGFDHELELWQLIAQRAAEVADARTVTLCLPSTDSPEMMRVLVAAGQGAEELTGDEYPIAGSLAGQVMSTGRGQLGAPEDFYCLHTTVKADSKIAETMAIPLQSTQGVRGSLVLSRSAEQPPFTTAEVKLAEDFADRAVIALELSEANALRHRVEAAEDRERIAADLHDHVIQQLFATGLRLQSSRHLTDEDEMRKRLAHSVEALDETIQRIRTTIFNLTFDADPESSLRAKLITLVTELEPMLDTRPRVHFVGPVDTVGTPELFDDVIAVVREALSNVAKHAQASQVSLTVDAQSDQLTITVHDDGVGLGPSTRRSGRANLERRAVLRGGSMTLESAEGAGTSLIWTVPT